MSMTAIGATDVGRERKNNEDAHYINNDLGIYLVCDGMGGRAGGEVASRLTVELLSDRLEANSDTWSSQLLSSQQHPALLSWTTAQIEEVCALVHKRAQDEYQGMGTTMTLLLISQHQGLLAHVGDSRLYLVRDDEVHQLSNDQTFVQEMLNRGIIKPEEAKGHPHRNVLLQSIGTQPTVEPDLLLFEVHSNDQFVLCSDGLSGYLEEPNKLIELLQPHALDERADALVSWANQEGGEDNITAIVVAQNEPAPLDSVTLDDTLRDEVYPVWDRASRLSFHQLREDFLCEGLPMRHVMRMFRMVSTQQFEAGEVVLRKQEMAEGLYVVLEGSCELTLDGHFARKIEKGHSFGLDALMLAEPSLEQIVATEPTLVMKLKRTDFLPFVQRRPRIGALLLKNVSKEQARRWRMFKQTAVTMANESLQS